MSGNSRMNYDKISCKRCSCGVKGLRLNLRRFSVQRLRTSFLYIIKRWKTSYRNCLRLLRRSLVRRRRSPTRRRSETRCGSSAVRTMNHSNSFCSEAIADCLEFIKRNSVSIDDERSPILDFKH